jgi:uncharacterized protein (TIGR02145 family)
MKFFVFLTSSLIILSSCKKEKLNSYEVSPGAGVVDIDGNFYKTVKVGETEWMAENLRVSKTNTGEQLAYFSTTTAFKENYDLHNAEKVGYTYYNFDSTYHKTYGKLYNSKASHKVCPTGWHLPDDTEWEALMEGFGGDKSAGGKFKETGFEHWKSPNTNADNATLLTFKPNGMLNQEGNFEGVGTFGAWWTISTKGIEFSPKGLKVSYDSDDVQDFYQKGYAALAIRCKRD